MKPYYQDEWATIYHGDCREVLPVIGTVGGLITDPPYGIGFDYGKSGHDDDPATYGAFIWGCISASEEHLTDEAYSVVFQSATTARSWADWFPRDWRLFAMPKAFAQIRPTIPFMATDYALYWRKRGGLSKYESWCSTPGRDWFLSRQIANTKDRPDHPCPRPIDAMRYLVGLFVPPYETVLDPFMGSGSTIVAAHALCRKSIGIEIEERYCEIAAKRLSQGVLELA